MPESTMTETWPVALGRHSPALERALALDPQYAIWPEGEKILPAEQPEAIAKVLIESHHAMIQHRAIAYLWVEKMEGHGKIGLGKARIASSRIKYFGDVDFTIDFNWTAWQELSSVQRVALVDHELAHFMVDQDTLKPALVPHDIEEFGVIVERWGLWNPGLAAFGESVQKAIQGELFAGRD